MKVKEALEALGLQANASQEEMVAAFKRRILRAHPDKARAGEDEATAKRQTQTLLDARAHLMAVGFFKTAAATQAPPPPTANYTAETQWRQKCARRRAHTADARERLWQTNRAEAQEARAEEWRSKKKGP